MHIIFQKLHKGPFTYATILQFYNGGWIRIV